MCLGKKTTRKKLINSKRIINLSSNVKHLLKLKNHVSNIFCFKNRINEIYKLSFCL
jgi:hypothetical protein